jgi:hypothetical protein
VVKLDNNEIKGRAKTLSFILISLFIVMFLYYLFVRFTGIKIPCIFFELTSLECPGCGITRMLTQFLQFNFVKGIKFNYFLGFTLPILLFMIAYMSYLYIFKKKQAKWFTILSTIYLISLFIWGILRNIFSI